MSRGRVSAVCGLGFAAAGTALPGKPADPARICPDCDTAKSDCVTGKRAYATETEAQDALLSTRIAAALHHKDRQERSCYSCPHCGHWHLTSQPKGRW